VKLISKVCVVVNFGTSISCLQ